MVQCSKVTPAAYFHSEVFHLLHFKRHHVIRKPKLGDLRGTGGEGRGRKGERERGNEEGKEGRGRGRGGMRRGRRGGGEGEGE